MKRYTCYLEHRSVSFSNVSNVKSLTWHFQQGSLENNIFAAGMRFLAEILPCLCYKPCVWGSFKKHLPKELEERIWLIWFDQILSWIWLIQERIWEEQSSKTRRQLFTNGLDFLINLCIEMYIYKYTHTHTHIYMRENLSKWESKDKEKLKILKNILGTSLVVHQLRLHAPTAGGLGLVFGQGTRSHMLQLKTQHWQIKI